MLSILADPQVAESFALEFFTDEELRTWLTEVVQHGAADHGSALIIERREGSEAIGYLSIVSVGMTGRPVPEMGYVLVGRYWGQGYATEAARALADEMLSSGQVKELMLTIRPNNPASIRVAEKLGAKFLRLVDIRGISYSTYRVIGGR
jgi:RimJ/RimL family protein N-acetyltransferase